MTNSDPVPTLTRRHMFGSALAALTMAKCASSAKAEQGGCRRCGCAATRCRKVCRLEKSEKKITTTCWGVELEDICLPGPSTPECRHCETICCEHESDRNIMTQPKQLVWLSWVPGCRADLFTKRKLMRKTVTRTVPSFKWVVEYLCSDCVAAIEPVVVPSGTKLPHPPDGKDLLVLEWTEEPSAGEISHG
ncbi:MAG: hypothetical protein ACK58L_04940 [Planctomycetota bacterium]